MPPQLALYISISFSITLYFIDSRYRARLGWATLVPFLWVILITSRPLSLWMNAGFVVDSPDDYLQGSAMDRAVFLGLLAVAVLVWIKRLPSVRMSYSDNKAIYLFMGYALISILWADFPFVALKRWIKGVGTIMMVAVLLSNPDPKRSFGAMMRGVTYFLIPLSLVFIKYFPQYGRAYSRWSGEMMHLGVTTNKNSLGALCMICGLFLIWDRIEIKKSDLPSRQLFLFLNSGFLLLTVALLLMADSATSLTCFILGAVAMVFSGFEAARGVPRKVTYFIPIIVLTGIILQWSMDIFSVFLSGVGRDVTLTGRVDLWLMLLKSKINWWIGEGYESFWLGPRAQELWDVYFWKPNQAHNGYLEIALNLGIIGLVLLGAVMYSAWVVIVKKVESGDPIWRYHIAIFLTTLLFNVTEAAMKNMSIVWFFFLLVVLQVKPRFPHQQGLTSAK